MDQISLSTLKASYLVGMMTCNTMNLLYVLICNGCNSQYIGGTGNELKTRMTVHRQQIRDPKLRNLKVSKHIYNATIPMQQRF